MSGQNSGVSGGSGQGPPPAHPALQQILTNADDIVAEEMNNAKEEIFRDYVVPHLDAGAQEAMGEIWRPLIAEEAIQQIGPYIEEAMRELPDIMEENFNQILPPELQNLLRQMATGQFSCASPCNCDPNCPGPAGPMASSPAGGQNREMGRNQFGLDQDCYDNACGGCN